jgi:pimeloyl-ACP methyl ester carboxylesterase
VTIAQFDGVGVYYEVVGTGEPLLLIHGAANSGRWFGDLTGRLAETHRVIVPDLRGLGRSQRISNLESPRVWVEDMWRIMDAAGADRAHIMGVSLGSRIAGRMVLENRTRVRTLTVDAPIIGLSAHGNTSLNSAFTEVDENSPRAREWQTLHGPDWRDAVAFYAKARSTPGLQEYLTLRTELPVIDVPTLICRGDFDDAIHPLEDSFIWHKLTPRSELFIAPGMAQSSVMLERHDDFLSAFRGFMDRVSAGEVP